MKSKRDRLHNAADTFWTSYSDLFLGMSVIFLLLYVTASLRSGTDGLTQAIETRKLKNEVEDLRTQLKAYDSIRKDYLGQQASPQESKTYEELMDKLSLLQEEARDERAKMNKNATELDKKERALNQYQQMVRNMINANVMAKNKIKTRENVIDDQDVEISSKSKEIKSLNQQVQEKQDELASTEEELQENLDKLKAAYKKNKMSKQAYDKKVAQLKGESEAEAEGLKGEIQKAKGQLAAKSGELKDTQGLLAKARAEADARKAVARDIKAAFAQAGVKADVDERTGEVEISFGEVYFNTGSANLKPQMKEILEKAMPAYAKSLLGNQKVSSKISSVEIVGFASPTYQGKMVDPKNLDAAARKAVDYNLDLSYGRARSLFQYVFDEKNMKFQYQKDMLPLIKVTGRSFLADTNSRTPAGKGSDFCTAHDCKKAQKVIIRFNFDEKK